MKGPGIFWMLQTAAGLSMAGPMFIIGLEFARDGFLVGGVGFFALGVIALYFPTWLLNRIGGPRAWIRRRLERRRSDDDEAESSSALLGRFRSTDDENGAGAEQPSRQAEGFRSDSDEDESRGSSSLLDRFRSD